MTDLLAAWNGFQSLVGAYPSLGVDAGFVVIVLLFARWCAKDVLPKRGR